ncbi:MFS transporter [Pseudomonas viridiflava]|uniref:MFS transporter n=1 Tax=Pseudomonas viridiflava TaxID=33069 RepID=UPI001C31D202|nr:MFS transporter [Pseudomonas viridiflava]QXG48993.1 MFS transporter [Pseudomonas viridiflava]
MTENDYLIAWSLYAFAALGCLLVWFLMTGWMWRYLKEPLRVIAAVLLLTPTLVDPVKDAYAPAVAITALDLMFKVGSNVWTAVSDLAMYGMFAFGAYLLFVLIRWPIERSRKARQPAPVAEPVDTDAEDDPFASDERYARKPAAPSPATSARGARVEPRL